MTNSKTIIEETRKFFDRKTYIWNLPKYLKETLGCDYGMQELKHILGRDFWRNEIVPRIKIDRHRLSRKIMFEWANLEEFISINDYAHNRAGVSFEYIYSSLGLKTMESHIIDRVRKSRDLGIVVPDFGPDLYDTLWEEFQNYGSFEDFTDWRRFLQFFGLKYARKPKISDFEKVAIYKGQDKDYFKDYIPVIFWKNFIVK